MYRNLVDSIKKVIVILVQPKYAAIAFFSSIMILGVLLWLLTLDTLLYVMTMPDYSAAEKAKFLVSPFGNTFRFMHQDQIAMVRLIFSVLAGIGVALLMYLKNLNSTANLMRREKVYITCAAIFAVGCILFSPLFMPSVLISSDDTTFVMRSLITLGYLIGVLLLLSCIYKMTASIVDSDKPLN